MKVYLSYKTNENMYIKLSSDLNSLTSININNSQLNIINSQMIVIKDKYVEAYFSEKLLSNKKPITEKNSFFEIGKEYILQGCECDEFTMPTRKFILVGIVDNHDGVELNSVVMKQIEGFESSMIFSLTKNDCKKLNIEFQPRLQIFPKSLEWKKVEEKKDTDVKSLPFFFDKNDLSTYPVEYTTKMIRNITLKISGFHHNCSDLSNLVVCFKSNNMKIPYRIITKYITNNGNGIVDLDGNVYVELMLPHFHNPNEFKNLSASDIFQIRLM